MNLKPNIVKLSIPKVRVVAKQFSIQGNTQQSENNLFYLDIDDAYVHQLFPLLEDDKIIKPNYFGKNSAGAHISIIYPEEGKTIHENDLQQEHNFLIKDLVTAEISSKLYYALLIESPSLLQLRKKYRLPDLLCFKGYSIGFHITIGVKML